MYCGKIHTWSKIKIMSKLRIETYGLEMEVGGRINITSLRFRFRVKDDVCKGYVCIDLKIEVLGKVKDRSIRVG